MLQQILSLSFPILSFIFSIISVSTADSNVYVQCSQLNFTSLTPYESNVNSLFISIANSASLYNFNKYDISPQSDGVYGLFQCRGDLSSPNCKDCVATAISQLRTTCRTSAGGEIQLEGCFVKYDDTSFFGAENKIEVCRRCGTSIGYNSEVLNLIDKALSYLVGGNGQYFRGGDFGSIQGVAQCIQDLSLSDCQDCLLEASGRLRSECETSSWGDMYLGKCYIRYSDQGNSFVNNGNSTSNNSSGEGSKDITKWIGYVIAAIIVALGAGVGVTVACKNTNKNKNTNTNTNINKFEQQLVVLGGELKTKIETVVDGATKELKSTLNEAKNDAIREATQKSSYPPQMVPPGYCYHHSDPDPTGCSVM